MLIRTKIVQFAEVKAEFLAPAPPAWVPVKERPASFLKTLSSAQAVAVLVQHPLCAKIVGALDANH